MLRHRISYLSLSIGILIGMPMLCSCSHPTEAESDVVKCFLGTLTSDTSYSKLAVGAPNVNGKQRAIIYTEPESYIDFDKFFSEIPTIYIKETDTYQLADISVQRIDTISLNNYRVKLKIGKRKTTIELQVTENNLIRTNLHGKGISNHRYKFEYCGKDRIIIYRNAWEKGWEERTSHMAYYNPTTTYMEPVIWNRPINTRLGFGHFRKTEPTYIIKEKGKTRSKIAIFDHGIHDCEGAFLGWVDNKHLVQDDEYIMPYHLRINFVDFLSIIFVAIIGLPLVLLLYANFGKSAIQHVKCIIIKIF